MGRSVIVAGAGKVGIHLASLLLAQGCSVCVIECRPELLGDLRRSLAGAKVLLGSASDPAVLEAAGARRADVAAAVAGSDEVNLAVASLARFEFGVPHTVARVNDPRNSWLFAPDLGVDGVVNQADLLGFLIAEEISVGDVRTLLKLHKGEYSLVEEQISPGSRAAGRALKDLGLPPDCVVAGVIRDGHLLVPRGHTVLEDGDEMLVVAHAEATGALSAALGRPRGS